MGNPLFTTKECNSLNFPDTEKIETAYNHDRLRQNIDRTEGYFNVFRNRLVGGLSVCLSSRKEGTLC
jgi:hypothetical protein